MPSAANRLLSYMYSKSWWQKIELATIWRVRTISLTNLGNLPGSARADDPWNAWWFCACMEGVHDDSWETFIAVDESTYTWWPQGIEWTVPDQFKHPKNSFARLFCMGTAANEQSSKSMKWHPLMIRWCLYLRHLSGKVGYDFLRARTLSLPSQRTLRDYTYYNSIQVGFSTETDRELLDKHCGKVRI